MEARYYKYILNFKRPGGTSRGILTEKETWFIILEHNGKKGVGECGVFRGLSIDDVPNYREKLEWCCKNIDLGLKALYHELGNYPSIQFGLEMAFKSIESHNPFILFPSAYTNGEDCIAINGLIWMGDPSFMKAQIELKLEEGFRCLKMKIGAIDFQTELKVLRDIRTAYSSDEIELRVDANGAFTDKDALEKLKQLSEFDLHSIEQPIMPGQPDKMARLCMDSPLDIALDEELIGITTVTEKQKLLQTIQPQYIILKPSLIGGYKGSEEWIKLCKDQGIGWWVTSALESNIGLNAIAQWTYILDNEMPQGLGTGSLFKNNFLSPLQVKNGTLRYRPQLEWNFNLSRS